MKFSLATSLVVLLFGVLLSAPAHSERVISQPGRFHGGQLHQHSHRVLVFVGAPIFWARYYAPDAAYDAQIDPASFYIPSMNGSYAPPPAPLYLYFCAEANAYYPYVAECLEGWQMVIPAPVD